MKTLIGVVQVKELAFADCDHITQNAFTEVDIVAAEQRYVLPILGEELYEVMLQGSYPELRDEFVAPVVAGSVRIAIQPLFDQRSGRFSSTVRHDSDESGASMEQLRQRMKSLRMRNRTMMQRLSSHLEANAELYVEYSSAENVMLRRAIVGDVVL